MSTLRKRRRHFCFSGIALVQESWKWTTHGSRRFLGPSHKRKNTSASQTASISLQDCWREWGYIFFQGFEGVIYLFPGSGDWDNTLLIGRVNSAGFSTYSQTGFTVPRNHMLHALALIVSQTWGIAFVRFCSEAGCLPSMPIATGGLGQAHVGPLSRLS